MEIEIYTRFIQNKYFLLSPEEVTTSYKYIYFIWNLLLPLEGGMDKASPQFFYIYMTLEIWTVFFYPITAIAKIMKIMKTVRFGQWGLDVMRLKST